MTIIAESMDTVQRGIGLVREGAPELIRRTREELPEALVANGFGTEHLYPADARSLDDVIRAYLEQVEAIQGLDARLILMASRAGGTGTGGLLASRGEGPLSAHFACGWRVQTRRRARPANTRSQRPAGTIASRISG